MLSLCPVARFGPPEADDDLLDRAPALAADVRRRDEQVATVGELQHPLDLARA